MNVLETSIIIILTALLTLLLLALYVKRTLPSILMDVAVGAGDSISAQLNETLANPNVKRAMSILGQHSGEARADNALRTKAAEAIVGQSPVIGMVLEKIGITPLEAVKLFNDPLFGPWIRDLAASFMQQGPGQGSSSAQSQPGLM